MKASQSRSWALLVPCLLVAVLATATLCRADGISVDSVSFTTANQSVWGPGTDAISVPLFSSSTPINLPTETYGSIDQSCITILGTCYPTGSYGVQVTAGLSGSIGASAALTLGGGSVNAQVPVSVTLGFPTTVANNTNFNITSSNLFTPNAELSTAPPGVSMSVDLNANLSGGINATACLGGCSSTSVPLNTGGPQTVNLLNKTLNPNIDIPLPGDVGSVTVGTPFEGLAGINSNVSTSGATETIQNGGDPATPFLSVNANVTNILADALELPPPAADVDIGGFSLGYNLFSLTLGNGLSSVQSFTLDATPQVAYNLDYLGSDPSQSTTANMAVGTPYQLSIPNGDYAVDVTPTYSMAAELTNQMGVVEEMNLGFDALSFSIGPLSTPSLFETSLTIPIGPPLLFSPDQFALGGWNTETGSMFQIDALGGTNPGGTVPEPSTLFLFGAGLLLLVGFLRRGARSARAGFQV